MSESQQLQDLKLYLGAKVERLARQHAEAKRQYTAVVTSLELLASGPNSTRRKTELQVKASEVVGKKLKEALRYIAEKCDGAIHVTPVRKLLIEAKVLRNGQSGSNRISSVLIEMPEFKRISRGKYRLIDDPESSEESTRTTLGEEIDDFYREQQAEEYQKIMREEFPEAGEEAREEYEREMMQDLKNNT